MGRIGNVLLAAAVVSTVAVFFIVPGIRVGINAIEQASLTLATKGGTNG